MHYEKISVLLALIVSLYVSAQPAVDLKAFKSNGAVVSANNKLITIKWPSGPAVFSKVVLDLQQGQPLFNIVAEEETKGTTAEIVKGLDPVFVLRQGKRTLSPSSGGWDVFLTGYLLVLTLQSCLS
ncbi:hypothetical protein [Niabella hibiscisoli]|uniref:hypothetical protein n=1 Tax=Niabella hibiscisoli TaxID=1825928 RepID=UPI001F0F81C5|nr:hypothetical protein [Niabella hibiscisoli]MCH5720748.1 hypothetical protein [Niabella hibiscisoli]